MSLLLFTATLLGGVVLGVLLAAAGFYLAAVREFADTAEKHLNPANNPKE